MRDVSAMRRLSYWDSAEYSFLLIQRYVHYLSSLKKLPMKRLGWDISTTCWLVVARAGLSNNMTY